MPAPILTLFTRLGASRLVAALLALGFIGLTSSVGCVSLRPRSERADAGVGSADAGLDGGPGPDDGGADDGGLDAGVDGGDGPADAAVDGGGQACDQAGTCGCAPTASELDLSVVAHGARLAVTGACFTDATAVRIGGVDQTFAVDDDGRITIDSVDDATPVGLSQPLVVISPVGSSAPLAATVAHLVVNEVDARTDTGAMQRAQFVEIDTGLGASVNLSEYLVVFFSGVNDDVYDTTRGAALGMTGDDGLYLLGGSDVSDVQASLPRSTLAPVAGAHAVVLYQGTVLPVANTAIDAVTLPMVDALVYSTAPAAADDGLLVPCYPEVSDRLQVDEAANGGDPLTQSIRRCDPRRRAGTSFGVAAPTPGAPNACL